MNQADLVIYSILCYFLYVVCICTLCNCADNHFN